MTADLTDPLVSIEQAFSRMAQCPGFAGAVLATDDGLVLVSAGALQGDAAAACAASLALDAHSALRTVGQPPAQEIMLWSGSRVWYEARLPSSHLLLATSTDTAHSGALRLAVHAELDCLQSALARL